VSVPAAPWQGRPTEVERTPTGEAIVRNRHGAFFQPHGERHWLPYEAPGELEAKLFRKRPRRHAAVIAPDFDVWSS
jgi:hypothetical protein